MNNNGNSDYNNRKDTLRSTGMGSGYDDRNTAMGTRDHSSNREQSSSIPKIKIYSQQVYKADRIDDYERQELRRKYGRDPLLLIFSPSSCRRLKECIEWGNQSRHNQVEQGGILLGSVKQYQKEIFSFVEDCALANTRGSSAFVEFTPDMWSSMQQEMDSLNAKRNEHDQLAIIGWFHTHPNGLSVFMSGTDQDTQNKNFSQEWQVSVVLNPHKKELRAFFGKEIREGQIVGWSDVSSQQGRDTMDKKATAEMIPVAIEKTGNPEIDAKIAQYQKIIEKCQEEIVKYQNTIRQFEKSIETLKKKKSRSTGISIVSLLLLFLVVALNIFSFLNKPSMSTETYKSQNTQASESIEPVSKKTSVVMFSITPEEWTSHNDSIYCGVSIDGKTLEGRYYYNTLMIDSNSNESFVELEAGMYTIKLTSLPKSTDGLVFKYVTPTNLTIDGINPKLVTIVLENEKKEDVTPESTSEPEVITTTEPTSENEGVTTTEPINEPEAGTITPTSRPKATTLPDLANEAENNVSRVPANTTQSDQSSSTFEQDTN